MGNPRENTKRKGFWGGASSNHGSGQQSAGRDSGAPGGLRPTRIGLRIDLDEPSGATPATPASPASRK